MTKKIFPVFSAAERRKIMKKVMSLAVASAFAVLIANGWACTRATKAPEPVEQPYMEETAPPADEGATEGDDGATMEETETTGETGGSS